MRIYIYMCIHMYISCHVIGSHCPCLVMPSVGHGRRVYRRHHEVEGLGEEQLGSSFRLGKLCCHIGFSIGILWVWDSEPRVLSQAPTLPGTRKAKSWPFGLVLTPWPAVACGLGCNLGYWVASYMGVSKKLGPFSGVLTTRIIVCRGLSWGPHYPDQTKETRPRDSGFMRLRPDVSSPLIWSPKSGLGTGLLHTVLTA